jgi:hypothetical protein
MDSTQMWFCRDMWVDAARSGLKNTDRGHHRNQNKRELIEVAQNIEPLEKREQDLKAKAKRAEADKRADADVAAEELADGEKAKGRVAAEIAAQVAAAAEDDPAAQREVPNRDKNDAHADNDGTESPADGGSGTDIDAMDEDAANPAPEALKKEDLPFMIPNTEFLPARILVNPRCLTTYGGVSHTKLATDLFGGPKDHVSHGDGNYALEDWAGAPDSFVCQEMRTTGGRTAAKSQRRVSFLLQQEVS